MQKTNFATQKSSETFDRILREATALFRKQGYEGATMRELARKSGIGLGSLYYYVKSKEELVVLFYEKINEQIIEAFNREKDPVDLPEVIRSGIEIRLKITEPYKDLMKVLAKEAIDPDSPVSPMSENSSRALSISLGLLERQLSRCKGVKKNEIPGLARAICMMQMGVIIYWLHDRSSGHKATKDLVETMADASSWVMKLSKIPGLGRLRRKLLSHISNVFP